jgi:hypothetical protein
MSSVTPVRGSTEEEQEIVAKTIRAIAPSHRVGTANLVELR